MSPTTVSTIAGLPVVITDAAEENAFEVRIGNVLRLIGTVRLPAFSEFWEASAANSATSQTHLANRTEAIDSVVRSFILNASFALDADA